MARRTHTNPNGGERFEILVELSHVNLGLLARSYAGITIFREVFQATTFNMFDPSTWFGGGRWVRGGNPGNIVDGGAFLNAAGTDISGQLNLRQTNNPGHFGRFSLFVFWGTPQPTVLGNDARSVTRVRVTYTLPWENAPRTLDQP